MKIVTSAQMRALDTWAMSVVRIPGVVLMENAGQAITQHFLSYWDKPAGKAVVVAGKGNNGGDGAVVARRLVDEGWSVQVLLCAERAQLSGDALVQFEFLEKLGISTVEVSNAPAFRQVENEVIEADLVVDALLGTGATNNLSLFFRDVVHVINQSSGFRLAVDLPTGVCADTGRILGDAVRANLTVTCAYLKHGLLQYPGAEYASVVKVAYVGIPRQGVHHLGVVDSVFREEELPALLPPRRSESHKGNHGHVLVVGGSRGKAGAALLTATGALRSGAGLVTVGTFPEVCASLEGRVPEVMVEGIDLSDRAEPRQGSVLNTGDAKPFDKSLFDLLHRKSVVVVGPGLGVSTVVDNLVHILLRSCRVPIVLDADALNVLQADIGACSQASGRTVLLPHPGEASRLLGERVEEIQENRPFFARKLAQLANSYVVLKGARTIVAAPHGNLRVVLAGNSVLATGGSGDVLAGVVATMIAQLGLSLDVVALAVHLHGSAADKILKTKGDRGILASEIAAELPAVFAAVMESVAPVRRF